MFFMAGETEMDVSCCILDVMFSWGFKCQTQNGEMVGIWASLKAIYTLYG